MRLAIRRRTVAALLALTVAFALAAGSAGAAEPDPILPAGFQDSVAIEGLQEPTAFRFAADGRIFVAEKRGKILVFDGLDDQTPTLFANLSAQVYDSGDRGLLGLALDPGFPARPYVYALYTFDHVLLEDPPGEFPRWGDPGSGYVGDTCPKPGDADVDECPVSGRLVRLTADGDQALGGVDGVDEDVLLEDWCQQTSSHSVGDLEFGPEGALFASGGDGASFLATDYGQFGWPQKNQCGDPPGAVGQALQVPSAEGGALRSQDLLTDADPAGLSGTVIRIDPDTGAGFPGNPFASSPDPNARRIIGFGFRNPFRFAIDPRTDEVYVGNVGGGPFEEIDRFSTAPSTPYNSGWPCYEASDPFPNFESAGLDLCEALYADPDATSTPFFAYRHEEGVTPEDAEHCDLGGAAISGSAIYDGAAFPPSYEGALFFADSVFGCIYVMFADADGRPDPSTAQPFLTEGGLYPGIDVRVGPDGDLYYAKMFGEGFGPGSIHRISYFSGNQPPVAKLTASPEWGASPLLAEFDASASSDADGEPLSYEWDLDGDGDYEAPTATATKTKTFTGSSNHTVVVRVSDQQGASRIDRVTVFPGNTPPQPVILDPVESDPGESSLTWGVGQRIDFEGVPHDDEDGDLAKTKLEWDWRLYHCPPGAAECHAHTRGAFPSVASGHFLAPDHDYPSRIELKLTATDSRGLSASRTIALFPRAVTLEIASDPPGLTLSAAGQTLPGPFDVEAIEGGIVTLAAPPSATLAGTTYAWQSWSDGGARVHEVSADAPGRYTATYAALPPFKGGAGSPASGPARPVARPRTRLESGPSRRTGRRWASFSFTSDDGKGGFQCRLDAGEYRPCVSPRVYRRLAPGRHAFRVRAFARTGAGPLPDRSPAVFRWRVLG